MNGWANYETWNASLWIGNDEFLYNTAKACVEFCDCLLYTSPSPRDATLSRMPSSA